MVPFLSEELLLPTKTFFFLLNSVEQTCDSSSRCIKAVAYAHTSVPGYLEWRGALVDGVIDAGAVCLPFSLSPN